MVEVEIEVVRNVSFPFKYTTLQLFSLRIIFDDFENVGVDL